MGICSIDKLDDDCWQLILEKLRDNNYGFSSVSIACKRFNLIGNRAKTSLFVSKLTLHLLPDFLRKFRNLKSLEICTKTDGNRLITQVLNSGLQYLESLKFHDAGGNPERLGNSFRELGIKMKSLKKLDLCGLFCLCDDDLMVLKDLFPCLEELDISITREHVPPTVTDGGIEALSSKLYGLRKITLRGCNKITDKSLMSLSSNCVELTDVTISGCKCLTENGIGFLIRYSPKLTSLSLLEYYPCFWEKESEFTFANSISYAVNLEHLKFESVTDGVLCAIAKASPPLKSFHFSDFALGPDFTDVLTIFVTACPFLTKFSATCRDITDTFVLVVSKQLRGLTHIDLTDCYKITDASFFTLTNNCHLLKSIIMRWTDVGDCEDIDEDLKQNYEVKHLDLYNCPSMNDRALVKFASVCPNLESLIIHFCRKITNTGVVECLRLCPKLEHLNVSLLSVSNFLGHSKEESKFKLKSISARETSINDEALKVIGERCPDLEKLNIRGCQDVTDFGVKELMSKCEKLRHLNLTLCTNVSIDIFDWIANLRPSLKRIDPPCSFYPTEEQRNLFLREGCMILRGFYSDSDDEWDNGYAGESDDVSYDLWDDESNDVSDDESYDLSDDESNDVSDDESGDVSNDSSDD